MKITVQLTPALTAALLCSAVWFSFWMLAFRPAVLRPPIPSVHPEATRLVTDDETLRKLKAPTLFALPSGEGFSGQFLENRVDLRLTLEKSSSPVRFLAPENIAAPGVNRALLTSETALPPGALPAPESAAPRTEPRLAEGTRLFLSPELKLRAAETLQMNIAGKGLPETVRINLTVRPDGTVEHALFDSPATNAFLLSAVRQLRFKPAAEKTEGWIDIRFAQEGKE